MSRAHTATSSVLCTPELLEAIFIHVDMTTLLTSAMRVNMTWHKTIASSPVIQQLLFFRPLDTGSPKLPIGKSFWVPTQQEMEEHGPELNPLLAKKFERLFFDFSADHGYQRRASAFYTLPWTSAPDQELEFFDNYRCPIRTIRKITRLGTTAAGDDELSRRRFTRRGASWRRMLISQPPPAYLGYLSGDVDRGSPFEGRKAWKALATPEASATGLRMGQLYDFVQHRVGHHSLHSLWFRIHWVRPREPFRTPLSREICADLLASTPIVVEMYEVDDWRFANHPPSPLDVAEFDKAYRCEEASILPLEQDEIIIDPDREWYCTVSLAVVLEVEPASLVHNWPYCRTL